MRYTYVRQHDTTDCAAACLAMVCLHYKKEVTITRLRDMMGTDLKGTNLVGLQKAANELGFTTAAVRVDRENFLSDFSLPCIAQVITDQGLAHFVVVFKKTTIKDDGERRRHMLKEAEAAKEDEKNGKKHKCKDYVVIGDPGSELKKISLDEFYKNFTGVLLLMNPTSEFKGGKIEKGGMFKRYVDLLLPEKALCLCDPEFSDRYDPGHCLLHVQQDPDGRGLAIWPRQSAGHADPCVQHGQHHQYAGGLCPAVGSDPPIHQDRYSADAGLLRAYLPSAHEVLCHPQDW